ncbi:hypothetical protein RHSIM_Rhsim13G0198900 [Rhododendron simsii]|uniref:Alpha/beta hydrolase fold-3 domain-containing protein n=1 Tax=Rhododendron simsii TaxID=118357 RepID=A0A834L480_RHOSS|nr:hypothetical protein RHSIM_Rhsim13G0198900 [Rhododendron simsii]
MLSNQLASQSCCGVVCQECNFCIPHLDVEYENRSDAKDDGIFISQAGYAEDILKHFGMEKSNPVESGLELRKSEVGDVDPTYFKSLNKEVELVSCRTEDQAADISAKPLKHEVFIKMKIMLGMKNPRDSSLRGMLKDKLEFWRLSIPVGETTDHPLVNPFGPASPPLERLYLDPILVVVGGADLLKDRAEDYTKKLKSWGKKVEYVEFEGKQHGFFTVDPNSHAAKELMLIIKQFIAANSS